MLLGTLQFLFKKLKLWCERKKANKRIKKLLNKRMLEGI